MARVLLALLVLTLVKSQEAPDAPVPTEETPAAPIEETPAAPIEETPAAPVEETPAAPIEETPAAPVEETPAAPVEETPAAPVEETPAAPVAPVAPVVPAAPAPAAPAAPVVDPPQELTGGELVAFTRNEYLEALAEAGIPATRGCWLYGDYRNDIPDVNDPISCAQACNADEKCFHWNFKFMMKRCDLKAQNGGVNMDIGDWITGDAARASNPPPIVP